MNPCQFYSLIYTFFWTLLSLSIPTFLVAQPENDLCENSRTINIDNYCSSNDAFTNENATPSGFSGTGGLSINGKDVWFRFTAVASDVVIIVRGQGNGGTLRQPEVELLVDTSCSSPIRLINEKNGTNNVVELYKGGLIVGLSYLFRVQGESANEGTFGLCVNNYFPPAKAGSDIEIAAMLCGKNSFPIPEIEGAGEDRDEGRGTCLEVEDSGINSEQSSTWFTWIADNDGTLEFTLTPSNPTDDIDFVVFKLPNGINNSAGRETLRCMATACEGPTGLKESSSDLEEDTNCDPGEDGFVKALDMEAGMAYGLLINNFTESKNGLTIDFGGTGEFRGPEPIIGALMDGQITESITICAGEQVAFSGANSNFLLGTIESYDWSFGPGASPQTGTGINPLSVTYTEPGLKSIVLTLTTDLGCKFTKVQEAFVTVEPCCEVVNNIEGKGTVTDLVCGNPIGAIDFMATSNSAITNYAWNTGETIPNISGLVEGAYQLTVTNLATCTATYVFPIKEGSVFTIDTILTNPTCSGGTDGSIELITDSPISVTWSDGISRGAKADNLAAGIYSVTIEDANGCSEQATFDLQAVDLVLDPIVATIIPPTCFGATNGFIEVNIPTGTAPFSYDWEDGEGFVDAASLLNLGANSYSVKVSDANSCEGEFEFMMEEPSALTVELEVVNASCGDLDNGMISAMANGGIGAYTYQWNTDQRTANLMDLAAGVYSLTVVDENQCETTEFANITQPTDLIVAVDRVQDVLCNGGSTGMVRLSSTGGNPPYEYTVNGTSFQTSPEIADLEAGVYIINIRDQKGCASRVEARVEEPVILQASIVAESPSVKLGKSTALRAAVVPVFEEAQYEWWPSEIMDCSTCPETMASPEMNTPIRLTVINANNCTATDSLFLNVQPNRDLFIPSAFSPSLNGVNDRFTIYGSAATQNISSLRIYNRWGIQVFEASNIPLGDASLGWDGQFNGQDVPTGVFIYQAIIQFIDGMEMQYGGDITLIR